MTTSEVRLREAIETLTVAVGDLAAAVNALRSGIDLNQPGGLNPLVQAIDELAEKLPGG